jgi:hypothetical protein
MNHFWANLFEHLKGCGQNATLFLVALAAFLGLVLVAAIAIHSELRQYLVAALPWLGLLLVVWSCRALIRARTRRRERLPHAPLSDDELAKARRRLGSGRKSSS